MKKEYYSTIRKAELFRKGYIAKKSAHSRGSAVDLTIVPLPLPPQEPYAKGMCECHKPAEKRFKDNSIDMGTGFDCSLTGRLIQLGNGWPSGWRNGRSRS